MQQQPPFNPYAAPTAGDVYPGMQRTAEFFRDGHNLVVRKGTMLPDVCVMTGAPTGGNAVTKTLTWVPPWVVILAVVVSPIIGVIVMMFVRKSGALTYFITREAQAKRTRGILIGVGLLLGGIGLVVAGIAAEMAALALLGFGGFLAGIIVAAVTAAPFRVNKIDADYIHLRVKPEFWSGLPPS